MGKHLKYFKIISVSCYTGQTSSKYCIVFHIVEPLKLIVYFSCSFFPTTRQTQLCEFRGFYFGILFWDRWILFFCRLLLLQCARATRQGKREPFICNKTIITLKNKSMWLHLNQKTDWKKRNWRSSASCYERKPKCFVCNVLETQKPRVKDVKSRMVTCLHCPHVTRKLNHQ